jgi:two-component system cell cycle sensor histidine kinase/response regulator CckA
MPTRTDISDTEDFFEMSLDCLCVAGLDGYFKSVNPSWTRTLGWSAAELMAVPSVQFVHPDDRERTLAARQKLGAGLDMGPLVNRYRCKDGSYRWFEWRSFGHAERGVVYAAARDVTEQRLAAERLRQAQEREAQLQRQLTFADRMASVGTLAGGVAHEINNPLASVMANIALIIEALDGAEPMDLAELRAMALDVKEGSERIRTIVRGVMTFSRTEEERCAVMDLRPVLELAVNMTSNEIRHRARLVTVYGATPSVVADEARLGQVFINLLLNAAQAIPEGHTIANEITLTTSTDPEGHAVVEVRDTGAGIAANVIGRVFDPFFTTKAVGVGTGLGLAISHGIVTGLGGSISVTSEPGRGTTFRVVLPLVAASASSGAPASAAPATPHVAAPRARAAILVVDDEPAVGKAIGRLLQDHDVTVVARATVALDLVAAQQRFDLIITDLMMPEMSGMDLYEELDRRFPDVAARVTFVTGGAFTPAAKAFLDRLRKPVLEKPFSPKQLRDHVERHLRRDGAR